MLNPVKLQLPVAVTAVEPRKVEEVVTGDVVDENTLMIVPGSSFELPLIMPMVVLVQYEPAIEGANDFSLTLIELPEREGHRPVPEANTVITSPRLNPDIPFIVHAVVKVVVVKPVANPFL